MGFDNEGKYQGENLDRNSLHWIMKNLANILNSLSQVKDNKARTALLNQKEYFINQIDSPDKKKRAKDSFREWED